MWYDYHINISINQQKMKGCDSLKMYEFEDEFEKEYQDYYIPNDLSIKINEIVTEEVKSKIKLSLEQLEDLKKENYEFQKQIKDLKNEQRQINTNHKKEIEEATKQALKEGERKFGFGFAVNDEVYYIKSESIPSKCTKCNGKYNLEIEILGKLVKINCPHCSGGTVYTYRYSPMKDQIQTLKFWVSKKDRNWSISSAELKVDWEIKAWLTKTDSEFNIKELYKTLEECQTQCDILEENQKKKGQDVPA